MTSSTFETQLQKKILVLDGAMGTMIQQADLTAEDFGGEEYEGCNEYLVQTCLLYTSPSPRDQRGSRMPSSA